MSKEFDEFMNSVRKEDEPKTKMNKEIKLAEHYWTSDYDVLEDKGDDYIVVKLHEPFKYHTTAEPWDIFLTKKPKQR